VQGKEGFSAQDRKVWLRLYLILDIKVDTNAREGVLEGPSLCLLPSPGGT
jgi:hypothetical protein